MAKPSVICVVGGDSSDGELISRAVERAGGRLRLLSIASRSEVVRYIQRLGDFSDEDRFPRSDVFIVDAALGGVCAEVIREIRRNRSTSEALIIAMSGAVDSEIRSECYAAGADRFFTKRGVFGELLGLLEAFAPRKRLRHTEMSPAVRAGEDDGPLLLFGAAGSSGRADAVRTLEASRYRFRVETAETVDSFAETACSRPVDLILADAEFLGSAGLEVIDRIRTRNPDVPIVLLTPPDSRYATAGMIHRSVDEYVPKTTEQLRRLPDVLRSAFEHRDLERLFAAKRRRIARDRADFVDLFRDFPLGVVVAPVGGATAFVNPPALELLKRVDASVDGIERPDEECEPDEPGEAGVTVVDGSFVRSLVEKISDDVLDLTDRFGNRFVLSALAVDITWHGRPTVLLTLHELTETVTRSEAREGLLKALRFSLTISEFLSKPRSVSTIFSEIPRIISEIVEDATVVSLRFDDTGTPVEYYAGGSAEIISALDELLNRGEAPKCLLASVGDEVTFVRRSERLCESCPPALREAGIAPQILHLAHEEARYGAVLVYLEQPLLDAEEFRSLLCELRAEISLTLYGNLAREREEELRIQLAQAQRLESIGRLAGGVAHDFNNMMTVVRGFCDLILSGDHDRRTVRNYVSSIRTASIRASEMTQKLLAYSRRQAVNPEVFDLNEVVTETATLLSHILGDDVELHRRLHSGPVRVRADRTQMHQVIMNLCVNSRDAMPAGGRLEIATAEAVLDERYAASDVGVTPGEYVVLSVTDTGCGMDADTVAQAFDPFFTTKPSGSGTGLGLSTVYGIAKQSGGNVWIYSEPGVGTTVKVYIPRVDAEPTGPAPAPKPVSQTGTETILLVEDQEMVRRLMATVLRESGYTVLEAASSSSALDTMRSHAETIDLLVVDFMLPDMTGTELAARARELLPEIRTVLTSGFTTHMITGDKAPPADTVFLNKPFSPADLRNAVRTALDEAVRRRS